MTSPVTPSSPVGEIPADVWEAVETIVAALASAPDVVLPSDADMTIARAILAERAATIERCAKVAEDYGDGGVEYDIEPEAAVATSVASKSIAASIRGTP